MPTVEETYAGFQQGSFGGITFAVASCTRTGRNLTTDENVIGLGSRKRLVVQGITQWQVVAHVLDDDDPWEKQRRLEQLMGGATGTYIDVWDGAQTVVADQWSFERVSKRLNGIPFSATFSIAELPSQPSAAGNIATSVDELVIDLAVIGQLMALEPLPAAQLFDLKSALDPADRLSGSDYTAAATAQLATGANLDVTGTPLIIQELGNTARTAVLGEFTRNARNALRSRTIDEIMRSNSPALFSMREAHALFLGALGTSAFGVLETKPQRRLQTITSDRSFNDLARLNRSAIQGWSITQEVQV